MSRKEDFDKVIDFIDFSLRCQEEIAKECAPCYPPAWNRGYCEAIKDVKKVIDGYLVRDGDNYFFRFKSSSED